MPTKLYTISSSCLPDVQQLGGKGASLAKLAAYQPVPPFIIIPVEFFKEKNEETILPQLTALLPEIQAALPGDKAFAVRSSATIEDGANHSFAGQFTTLLNVPFKELSQAIHTVWQSGFSEGVKGYKQSSKITSEHRMAVVVQQMVDAAASGVAFGINPLTGNPDETVINAVSGLGESLVSGQETADTYIIRNGQIAETRPAGESPVLTGQQVNEVTALLQSIGGQQDIEFAFEDSKLYLLQSRPVTAIGSGGERIVWDNSNIVESYPGLTLPLTFSFIEKMYEAVYRQFSLVLGVNKKTVKQNAAVYASMLGLLNGRVYYNLNSWYRSLAQLPGYSLNAEFMEKMMGVKEKPPIELPPNSKAGFGDYWQVVQAVAGVVKSLLGAKKGRQQFIADFETVYRRFDGKDYTGKSLAEITTDYSSFEQLMVSRWKAPLVNDLFAMIYFGLLQKQCAKYAPDLPNLHNQLIASSRDIITTEPMRLLPVIAKHLAENSAVKSLFETADAGTIWQQLQQPQFVAEKTAVQDYINVWGERSVAELKLETITYRQQPERLIGLLQSYIQNRIFSYGEKENADDERQQAEVKMQKRLKGKWGKRKLFNHILRQARYFVSNRENLRYYRTKGFGMVRQMMLAAGTVLRNEGWLDDGRDVFYLQLPELLKAAKDETEKRGFKTIIPERKRDYELYETMPLPQRIFSNGQPGKFVISTEFQTVQSQAGSVLQGIPCSAGVVRARVRIVKESSALTTLNGCVLATYATDPGWVVLFPSAAGIITERGSLLSHAAIVSREMGIPCIVGVEGLLQNIPDGIEILMDGSTGLIQIVNPDV